MTTYYVGNTIEWTGSTATMIKYYYAGGQRVAMRKGSTLYFLLGDHLGSTSVTANSNGTLYTSQRYYPWGGTRGTSSPAPPTSYQYTGQRNDSATGLYFYNARYYDPALGRFLAADSIVPDPANPQSLNRYSYVLNNPLVYVDPSGHREIRYSEEDWITPEVFSEYAGEWNPAEQARNRAILETVAGVGDTVLAMFFEPYDWVSTGARCTQGGCNWLDYAGFLPLIPGALGRVDDVARAADKIDDVGDAVRQGSRIIPDDLHAFGGRTTGPRPPRVDYDIFPDSSGMIGPEDLPFPHGASTFANVNEAPLTGHYHTLPKGYQLPEGLAVVADGQDVLAGSLYPPTHHTIFPTTRMHSDSFVEFFKNLGWIYGGKK